MKEKNNEKDNEIKNKKNKKYSLISSIIVAVIVAVIFHIRYGVRDALIKLFPENEWAYYALLLTVFFVAFTITFLFSKGVFKIKREKSLDEQKRRKEFITEGIFLVIDFLMTGSYVYFNLEYLQSVGLMWAIAQIAIFFGIVWVIFELFNHFKFFPGKLLSFFSAFLFKVCIPSLFLIIILLGAHQAKYGYLDIFREQVILSSQNFGTIMADTYNKIVFTFYDLGQSNPDLWSWLPIVAIIMGTLILLVMTFIPKEKGEEDYNAQELINKSILESKEEEEYEEAKKKKEKDRKGFWNKLIVRLDDWLTKEKREKEKKEKEEEEKLNKKIPIFNITLERGSDKKTEQNDNNSLH